MANNVILDYGYGELGFGLYVRTKKGFVILFKPDLPRPKIRGRKPRHERSFNCA